jgi:hypothetical protein
VSLDAEQRSRSRERLATGVKDRGREIADGLRSGRLALDSVVMAARLECEEARPFAPATLVSVVWTDLTSRREAIRALGSTERQVSWAADVATHILPLFEKRHPGDMRPRQSIEAARAWAACPCEEHLQKARAAAAAAAAAAYAANAAAAAAAASAANAADAANAAAYAAYSDGAREMEIAWQKERLVEYLLNEVEGL